MSYLDDLQMVKGAFFDIARHTKGLAVGLQQAAPPQEGVPPSVQYLTESTEQLQDKLDKVVKLIEELNL